MKTKTGQLHSLPQRHPWHRPSAGRTRYRDSSLPLVGKFVSIDGVQCEVLAHGDKPSGHLDTIYQRVDIGEIAVAHRGTESDREPLRGGP